MCCHESSAMRELKPTGGSFCVVSSLFRGEALLKSKPQNSSLAVTCGYCNTKIQIFQIFKHI